MQTEGNEYQIRMKDALNREFAGGQGQSIRDRLEPAEPSTYESLTQEELDNLERESAVVAPTWP